MIRLVAAAACAIAVATPSWAADGALMEAPAHNDHCIRVVEGAPAQPEFPREVLEAKKGGIVRIDMEFADANSSPRVRVVERPLHEFGQTMVWAVERFTQNYRNVCMRDGDPPSVARQEFAFVPNDGRKVTWSVASPLGDSSSPRAALAVACVQQAGELRYPRGAVAAGVSARVVARARFNQYNEPPEISFVVPSPRKDIEEAVVEHMKSYRLTCGGAPVEGVQTFEFHLSDAASYVLRDMTLKTFVVGARNATQKPVYFDLDSMGCPFDVRMRYWQPFSRNSVGEVGEPNSARRVFLDWLAGLELNLQTKYISRVAGDELTIAVPCGKIDF